MTTATQPEVPEARDGDAAQSAYPAGARPVFAPGAQVRIRDEQWLVKSVAESRDGLMVEVSGVSPFVRGTDAVFYSGLDQIDVLDPRKTRLVPDDTSKHAKARLYLEAVIRKTALPQTEHGIALADSFLMDRQEHQLRPAELALSMRNPQPRLLIADVVGLGKTLEIGLTLAELIRRGRGERILVVTPAHVLEQFQRELWTRFSLPLVRLDSTGIQRIQQEIPAGRNPFAHFKRVIVSVDTLKSATYAHHLENITWDAVVIDESHNLMNKGTRNNRLARRLAEQTDALILASATPHNGDAESFAELIRMLDPAAIADPKNYKVADLDHLYIRRTKTDREVRDGLKGKPWAERGPSLPVQAPATPKEVAVLEKLASEWTPGDPDRPSVCADPLVGYNFLKAFLSSHVALRITLARRRAYLDNPKSSTAKGDKARTAVDDPARRAALAAESTALAELEALVADFTDQDSAKLGALVRTLKDDLGVGPGSERRVVIFSERVDTLNWLAQEVPARLGFKKKNQAKPDSTRPWKAYDGAVEVMHGDTTNDQQQQEIVDRFGRLEEPVRLLFTGDLASEGVNLHHQCHDLIHYDLPWSLIRIEQRNGRIDRYGQAVSPEFRALILTADVPWRHDEERGETLTLDDRLVGARLLRREEQAHEIETGEGSAEAVTGLYNDKKEEDRLTRDLLKGGTVERSIKQSQQESGGVLAGLLAGANARLADPTAASATLGKAPVREADVPHVFAHTKAYFQAAVDLIYPQADREALDWKPETAGGRIEFTPPDDLQYRFRELPKSYLEQEKILTTPKYEGTLRITFDKNYAADRLEAARNAKQGKTDQPTSQWPNVSYVSDIHPVLDWVTDKVLAKLRYDEAFVLAYRPDADKAKRIDAALPKALTGPVYLLQGVYSNAAGKPTVVEWMAVTGLAEATPRVWSMDSAFLAACGVGPDMPGRGRPVDPDLLQALVPAAVDAAETHLRERRADYDKQVDSYLAPYEDRVQVWEQGALIAVGNQERRRRQVYDTAARRRDLVRRLRTDGDPMLRVLAVLEPLHTSTVSAAQAEESAR
ncbi:helicase [Streptomyces violarus]|uniref:ERCC4-related helicase n=1 Tax=Streptomyces violarus TaxID=67380 RepID=A0A7W4ZQ98_9ACTN|nr:MULTISPECIES: DEAD/DEAH box helicase [Streptomyces]MBB3076707.1 ERCC4-related helicase [Streptomyces violarus]WRU01622.1 DEAD/DEAH box helicase [Streptomyces sp. CGMCC 4.1772]GHD21708.1 helicase [Streptomyces violarus]